MNDEKDDEPPKVAGKAPTYPPGEIPVGAAFDGSDIFPMVMSQFIGYVENVCRLAKVAIAEPPDGEFFCIVVPPAGSARCHAYGSLDDLVAQLRSLHGQEIQVFAFLGVRLGIARGGGYLLTPSGPRALFVPAGVTEVDDEGFMGDVPPTPPSPGEPAADEGDEDDDDEEDGDGFAEDD